MTSIPSRIKSKRCSYDDRGFLINRNMIYEVSKEEGFNINLRNEKQAYNLDEDVFLDHLESGTFVSLVKTTIRYDGKKYEYYDENPLTVSFRLEDYDPLGFPAYMQCPADDYTETRNEADERHDLRKGFVEVKIPNASGGYDTLNFGSIDETAMAVDISVSEPLAEERMAPEEEEFEALAEMGAFQEEQ